MIYVHSFVLDLFDGIFGKQSTRSSKFVYLSPCRIVNKLPTYIIGNGKFALYIQC